MSYSDNYNLCFRFLHKDSGNTKKVKTLLEMLNLDIKALKADVGRSLPFSTVRLNRFMAITECKYNF